MCIKKGRYEINIYHYYYSILYNRVTPKRTDYNKNEIVFRLWDAVGGFLFLFSHMQDKLSKHSSQVDLLKELLNLQKDMITMMLSMLEGNVVNGKIHLIPLSKPSFSVN